MMTLRKALNALANSSKSNSKRFVIRSPLPTLNEYINASRGNLRQSARIKKESDEAIMWEVRSQLRGWKTDKPVFLLFKWVEKDKRRDKDNVAFAKKFVQDALVKAGVLQGDGWQHVTGFIDLFGIDKKDPRVEVIIVEVGDGS